MVANMNKRLVRNFLTILILLNLLIPFLCVAFPVGFSMEGDALDYRYSIVKMIQENHSIPILPWTYNDDYPLLGEVLFALSLKVSMWGPRIVSALSYVSFSAATFMMARSFLPGVWALLVVLISMTSTLVTAQDNLWMVDLMASSFSLWAIYFLMRAAKAKDFKHWNLVLAGLFSGFAMLTRYTQMPVTAMLALMWLLWSSTCDVMLGSPLPRFFKKRVQEGLLYLVPALFVFLPLLVRNSIVNHNPLFPFLTSIFGGKDLTVSRAAEIFGVFANHCGFERGFLDFLLLPYRFAFYVDAFDYSVGPYFLFFFPWWCLHLALVVRKKTDLAKFQDLFSVFLTLGLTFAWFMGSRQGRFLSHVIPCVVLSGLIAIHFWVSRVGSVWVRNAFLTLLAVMGVAGAGKHIHKHKNEFLDQWDAVRGKTVGSRTIVYNQIDAIEWVNQNVGTKKVLFIERTNNIALLKHPYIFTYPHVYATSYLDFRTYPETSAYYDDLKKANVGFLCTLDDGAVKRLPLLKNASSAWVLVYSAPSGGRVYKLAETVP